jgi:hypothetical protein
VHCMRSGGARVRAQGCVGLLAGPLSRRGLGRHIRTGFRSCGHSTGEESERWCPSDPTPRRSGGNLVRGTTRLGAGHAGMAWTVPWALGGAGTRRKHWGGRCAGQRGTAKYPGPAAGSQRYLLKADWEVARFVIGSDEQRVTSVGACAMGSRRHPTATVVWARSPVPGDSTLETPHVIE